MKSNTVFRVIALLPKEDQRRYFFVLLFVFFSAIIETIGVGAMSPFLAVASNSEVIHSNALLNWTYTTFGFTENQGFTLFVGFIVLFLLIVTNLVKATSRYLTIRFTSNCRHVLSSRLMDGYLRQEYSYFLQRNSFDFVKTINNEIQNLVSTTLIPSLELMGGAIQFILIAGLLLVMDPVVCMIILAGVGVVYCIIFLLVKGRARTLGETRFQLNRERGRVVSEAFWGIKEAKLSNSEWLFSREYQKPSLALAKNESSAEVMADVPKFALETAAFTSILVYILYIIGTTGNFTQIVVTAGLFLYAGFRMLPALQLMVKSMTKLRYGAPTVDKLEAEFAVVKTAGGVSAPIVSRQPFTSDVKLKGVCFRYPSSKGPVLEEINLVFKKYEMIGIIGATGSGKSTLIDILLGLLFPQQGTIAVDGVTISRENILQWQANIGYVPQVIYLSNTTVARNIAFGVPEDQIDMELVIQAAKVAQIHDFVVNHLPEGYTTKVGERGNNLSGGQRQRLGIARALYRQPEVLVFDEATSALDTQTEADLMQAVDSIAGKLTIIMVAHRLTTLRNCHKIFQLTAGRLVESGSNEAMTEGEETNL